MTLTSLFKAAYWRNQAIALGSEGWSIDAELPSQLQRYLKFFKKNHVLPEATIQTLADCFSGAPVSL